MVMESPVATMSAAVDGGDHGEATNQGKGRTEGRSKRTGSSSEA